MCLYTHVEEGITCRPQGSQNLFELIDPSASGSLNVLCNVDEHVCH